MWCNLYFVDYVTEICIQRYVLYFFLCAMFISSPDFASGAMIPEQYTCRGAEIPPSLLFGDIPSNAKSLALSMDDPDAPVGLWTHWLVWNIPVSTTGLTHTSSSLFPQWRNTGGKIWYRWPCPPSGTHRYYFTLYALDIETLSFDAVPDRKMFDAGLEGHIIQKAEYMGRVKSIK